MFSANLLLPRTTLGFYPGILARSGAVRCSARTIATRTQSAASLARWKGTMPWHRWFTGSKGYSISNKYIPTFNYIEAVNRVSSNELLMEILRSIRSAQINESTPDFNIILDLWKDFLKSLESAVNLSGTHQIDIKTLPKGQILSSPLLRVVSFLGKLSADPALFDKFWTPIASSPLSVEIIPVLIRFLCNKGSAVEAGHRLLLHLGQFPSSSPVYQDGINYGLNVVIMHYFKISHNPNGISTHWQNIYSLISSLDLKVQVSLLPQVADHFALRIPPHAYPDFYKLFLRKNINLRDKRFLKSLRSFYEKNELCRRLMVNTDYIVQQDNEQNKALQHSATFCKQFYCYLFKRLSRSKDSERTAWFLDNLLAKSPDLMPIEEVMKLLLIRSVEVEEIVVSGIVYESMIQKGLMPDNNLLVNLFRGFRLRGLQDKCWEVVRLLESKNQALGSDIRTEILTLLRDQYPSRVVVHYFDLLFPSAGQLLEEVGIRRFIEMHTAPVNLPSYEPSENTVCHSSDSDEWRCALNVVYQSVLSNLNEQVMISELYQNYRGWILSHPTERADMKVIDSFVDALCRVHDPRSASIGNIIFRDAVQNLKFSKHGKSYDYCLSLTRLSHAFCIYHDVDSARELVSLAELHPDLLGITSGLISPIIRYYLKDQDLDSARSWVDYSAFHGLVLTDSHVIPFVECLRKEAAAAAANTTTVTTDLEAVA